MWLCVLPGNFDLLNFVGVMPLWTEIYYDQIWNRMCRYAQLHMVSLLPTKFHELLFSSFRGVALTNCVTDRQTDRRTDGQDKNNMSPHQSGGRHNMRFSMRYDCTIIKNWWRKYHNKLDQKKNFHIKSIIFVLILFIWFFLRHKGHQTRMDIPKYSSEAACQHNSSETSEQNFMKLGR
jgi:hypothetical protein